MASAARRLKASSIDWTALAERVPKHQKSQYLAFKAKSDGYLRRMLSHPEEPPKIDWAYYKARVAVPGMVDDFQKKYESLKIPYPADNLSPQIEARRQQLTKEIQEFVAASNARIAEHEAEVAKIRAMVPFEMMTLDDFKDAYPEEALDPLNKPTFWPHEPEDQLDYEEENPQIEAKH